MSMYLLYNTKRRKVNGFINSATLNKSNFESGFRAEVTQPRMPKSEIEFIQTNVL